MEFNQEKALETEEYPGLNMLIARRNRVNLNYIIKHLESCSDLHDDCYKCEVRERCVRLYDERCSSGETTCPSCLEEVPAGDYCSNCGFNLKEGRRRGIKGRAVIKLLRERMRYLRLVEAQG